MEYLEFVEKLKSFGFDINYDNAEYLNLAYTELKDHLYKHTFTRWRKNYFNVPKQCNHANIIFQKSLGWTDETLIKEKISQSQKERSSRTVTYWVKKGFSKEEAKNKVKEVQSSNGKKNWERSPEILEAYKKSSRFFKEYWIEQGYSEEETKLLRNPMKEEWFGGGDLTSRKKKMGDKLKQRHKEGAWDLAYSKKLNYTSKEEIEFFEIISEIKDIKHKGFGICTKKIDCKQNYKLADGYFKYNEGIILIEYDGTYWHDKDYDDFLDKEILKIRPDIRGIIRVQDNFFKKNKENIIIEVKNAIEKIKNSEERTVRICFDG